jgi:hypothetical protein
VSAMARRSVSKRLIKVMTPRKLALPAEACSRAGRRRGLSLGGSDLGSGRISREDQSTTLLPAKLEPASSSPRALADASRAAKTRA